MADDVKTEEEPSIEEILDSIRQIIADDDDEEETGDEVAEVAVADTAAPAPEEPLGQSTIDDMDFDTPAPEAEPEPEPEKSVEPLDQSAIDDIDFAAPEPEPEPTPEPEEEIIELTDRVDDEPEVEIKPEIEPEPEESVPEPEPRPQVITDDVLLTKNAEDATFDAISELARKTAIEHNGITLEDIVRSEIKPMLSAWLDKNLPVIIERLVQEELERVSKRVLED